MTVVITTAIQRWVGVSGDTKPVSPPAGSTFYETDTGATYIYDGAAWQLRLSHTGLLKATKTITFDGTAALGVVGNVTLFVGTGEPVDIDANEFWTTTDPTAVGGIVIPDAMKEVLIANGADIVADPTNDDTTGGVINFIAYWRPVSSDGLVMAA